MKLNTRLNENHTPLEIAIHYNRPDVVGLLLKHGASPNSLNANKQSPLHIAVEAQNKTIVHMLLKYGAWTDL